MDESIFKMVFAIPRWQATGAILIIAFIVGAVYFHRRAGTSYGLLSRLYALLIGGSDFHHDSLIEFWKERRDVERFNALFNIKAKSATDIERFNRWIKDYDLDVSTFTKLKSWFDLERRKVRKVKKWQYISPLVLVLVAYFATVFTAGIGFADAALIKLGGEDQWIWLNHKKASSFNYNPFRDSANDWYLTKSACEKADFDSQAVADSTGLKQQSISAICNSFDNADDAKHIDDVILDQKIFLLIAVIPFLFGIHCYLEALRRANVKAARRHLYNKLIRAKMRKRSMTLEDQDSTSARKPSEVTGEIHLLPQ